MEPTYFTFAETWFNSLDEVAKDELRQAFPQYKNPMLLIMVLASRYRQSLSQEEHADLVAHNKDLRTGIGFARYYAELPRKTFIRGLHQSIPNKDEE